MTPPIGIRSGTGLPCSRSRRGYSARLTAWEAFKVYDGQIHMVEAYIRLLPAELDLGGWPVAEGIVQP